MRATNLVPAISDSRASERRLYLWVASAAFVIVFAGFARTYFLRFLFQRPALSWFLWGHGTLMVGWFVLFFVQIALVRSHRVALHRRLGWFGAMYATLMVVSGVAVAVHAAARDMRSPDTKGAGPLVFMGGLFILISVFAILVGAAVLLRRRRDYHKRLMLLSVLSMISPALFRIPLQTIPSVAFLKTGGPIGIFSIHLLMVYVCAAWDTWRHRRLHPAFAVGGLLIVAESTPLVGLVITSTLWIRFATWLVN